MFRNAELHNARFSVHQYLLSVRIISYMGSAKEGATSLVVYGVIMSKNPCLFSGIQPKNNSRRQEHYLHQREAYALIKGEKFYDITTRVIALANEESMMLMN